MELQTHLDALMYKVFPTNPTRPARAWFNYLTIGSIKGFMDLANVFINRFIVGVSAKRKTSYLEIVSQRRNESLREYVARFNSEALQIFKLDEARAVEAMQDDALTTSRFAREGGDRGKAVEDTQQERVEVLVVVQEKDFIQWPKPMKAEANRRDPDKYCQYHRTHGHDTNDYYQLINEIEKLIKMGHLMNFVKKPEGQRPQQNVMGERPHRQTGGVVNNGSNGTINMIVGGSGGRMSRSGEGSSAEVMQIVEHSHVTIYFSSEDAHGIQMHCQLL
ncbi:uncharacterized protein LOC110621504 [Manihot esculenta]|uniref:uncharacterized protein LOC110621504 n=1 Tax=Manihot esculenta TaxID=3983 RepID=UPI000B5D5087|nr:uncharacterized protein LOC110621504 [Manihot esculenta]